MSIEFGLRFKSVGGATSGLLFTLLVLSPPPLGDVSTYGRLGGTMGGVHLSLLLEFCLEWRGELLQGKYWLNSADVEEL